MKSLNGRPQEICKIDSLILKSIFIKMNSNELFELQWGNGMFSEGKQYIVETYHGFYKGTYKKPVMAIPYVILYNVIKDKNKMAQVIFYREDKFYDASDKVDTACTAESTFTGRMVGKFTINPIYTKICKDISETKFTWNSFDSIDSLVDKTHLFQSATASLII